MRIRNVRLDKWKGLQERVELGHLTYVTGPNGSGKTALLQSVGFGLAGHCHIGGRLEDVAQLFGTAGGSVGMEFDDDFIFTRAVHVDHEHHKLAQEIKIHGAEKLSLADATAELQSHNGEVFAPMFDLGEFLDLSGEARRNYVLELCGTAKGGGTKDDDTIDRIVEEYLKAALGVDTVKATAEFVPDRMDRNQRLVAKLEPSVRAALAEALADIAAINQNDCAAWITEAMNITNEQAKRAAYAHRSATAAKDTIAQRKAALTIEASSLPEIEAELTEVGRQHEGLTEKLRQHNAQKTVADTLDYQRISAKAGVDSALTRLKSLVVDEGVNPDALEAEAKRIETPASAQVNTDAKRAECEQLEKTRTDLELLRAKADSAMRSAQARLASAQATIERVKNDPWMKVGHLAVKLTKEYVHESVWPVVCELCRLIDQQCKDNLAALQQAEADSGNLLAEYETQETAHAQVNATLEETSKQLTVARAEWAAAIEQNKSIAATEANRRMDAQRLRTEAANIRRTIAQRADAQKSLAAAEAQLAKLTETAPEISKLDVEAINAQLRELDIQKSALLSRIQAKRTVDGVEKELAECMAIADREQVMHEVCKSLIVGIKVARESLLKEWVQPLMAPIRTFLRAAGIESEPYCRLADDKGKALFELGWIIGDQRVSMPALSGGERAIYGAALAYSLVKLANPKLRLFLIEAGDLDLPHLEQLLLAIETVKAEFDNVVVATHVGSNVTTPGIWTVIQRTRPLRTETAAPAAEPEAKSKRKRAAKA